jgi:signal peptidase I
MSPSTAIAPARIESELGAPSQTRPRVNPIGAKIRTNGSACFRVLGTSMFPWVRSGDFVFVRRSDFATASVGEVVLFEREQRLFVHRVLRHATDKSAGQTRPLLITKGDALDRKDAPISMEEFLGRVTRVHRGQRHIDLETLGRLILGRFLALVSPASFLVYGPLRMIKRILFT